MYTHVYIYIHISVYIYIDRYIFMCMYANTRLPALDPAYLLTCSNPCVGLASFYFAKPKTP